MEKATALFLLLFSFSSVTGQKKMAYAYDSAGNRIRRGIVVQYADERETPKYISRQTNLLDMSNDIITLKHTGENISITVKGTRYTGNITLYNIMGAIVSKAVISSAVTMIDMGNLCNGVYFLYATTDKGTKVWKIAKN